METLDLLTPQMGTRRVGGSGCGGERGMETRRGNCLLVFLGRWEIEVFR